MDLEDFREGIIEYTDAVSEIADGSKELRDGVRELQEEADDMIEEYFTFDIDKLTQFLIAEDNPRIDAAAGMWSSIGLPVSWPELFSWSCLLM